LKYGITPYEAATAIIIIAITIMLTIIIIIIAIIVITIIIIGPSKLKHTVLVATIIFVRGVAHRGMQSGASLHTVRMPVPAAWSSWTSWASLRTSRTSSANDRVPLATIRYLIIIIIIFLKRRI
jgi:hypothetical protein